MKKCMHYDWYYKTHDERGLTPFCPLCRKWHIPARYKWVVDANVRVKKRK